MGNRLVALIFDESDDGMGGVGQTGFAPPDFEPERAFAVLEEITQKAKEADARLEDAVVVYRTVDKRIKIKQTKDMTVGKGARRGAFWGLLVGLLLGGPIGGLLGGMGVGAIFGRKIDKGVSDQFIKDVGNSLKPNTSAIMLLIGEEDYDRAIPYLKTFGAELHETALSQETEQAVEEAVLKDDIAQAAEAEYTSKS
ncbi:MAG TPA: DUF1269 domain-containing protein [Anaerolineae bacterium]|nr:DUF1269 domain-containing protein [Anaerolineae bacterium]MCB0179556.1 DUF1269 domain-containing protein [Anaerolineae bacterium]MCB0222213.1 DUF1269 domain-containing protein [Anaerolineae bacterium]MCB9102943.1 DUF1269 domain-containing protein [Anaerolineales bacterium]HRV92131.1 DUF1269 domain-containing protein [Anaerolineae bacterium]